jgi:anti-anti-sigma regulatory factor
VETYTSYKNLGGWVIFANPREHVKRLLRDSKLDRVFEIVPTVAEAVALLKARERSTTAF